MSLPLTIIGGYLGAGKTTLVNHLLRNADGKRLAVLVNEFGELPIDADLIEGEEGDVIALAGGCVCCSYGDDLTGTLLDMTKRDPAPDHVLLEASGVAIPGAIAASLSLLSDFNLTGIVVMVDTQAIDVQIADRYVGDTIKRQLCDADLLLLNKTDLVESDKASAIVTRLMPLVGDAVMLPVANGEISPDVVLGNDDAREDRVFSSRGHEAAIFATRSFTLPETTDADSLKRWLYDNKDGLVRAKGFAPASDGLMQSVQLAGDLITVCDANVDANPGIALIGLRDHPASQGWLAIDEGEFVKAVIRSGVLAS